ncbi:EamA family transporter, partial [Nocardioides sp. CER28]
TLCGAVVLSPLLLVGGRRLPDGPVVTGWLLYLGVATMAGAYLLLYAGLRSVPAHTATLASLLEPVTAALVAGVVLDERIGLVAIVGVVLVLVAVAGLGRTGPDVTRTGQPVAPPA